MRVFELERARRSRSRVDAAPLRRRTRFVGRTAELASLKHAVDEALVGRGSVVGVVGEPGVGKTRLCAELLRYARDRAMMLARSHCPAHTTEVPLLAVVDLLRSFFRLREGEAAEATQDKVRRRLRALRRSFVDQLPVALDLLGVPEETTPAAADADARQHQRVAFVRRLIQTQSAKRPLLLVIDDAQCMDQESSALVAEMVDALGWTHTLLLINYRPGYHADWMRVPYWRELPVATLDDKAIDDLLRALVGDDPSTTAVRQTIRTGAGGNPFFAEEIVQSLLDHGVLGRPTDTGTGERARPRLPLHLERPAGDVVLPPNVHALLAARIDRLTQRDRVVVQAASVIGRTFSAALLCRVLGSDHRDDTHPFSDEELQSTLDRLETAAFVRRERASAPTEYAFRHPLTQAVAYAAPLAAARNRLHLAVARALEQLHAERLGQHAAVIGHHYGAGGWTYEAARWRKRAALQVTNITLPRNRRQ
jgi:predicted ATPase